MAPPSDWTVSDDDTSGDDDRGRVGNRTNLWQQCLCLGASSEREQDKRKQKKEARHVLGVGPWDGRASLSF